MATLTIRFMWTLLNQNVRFHYAFGPLFARWLPDGEMDKLSIPTDDSDIQLHVWIERRGYVDGLIHYDYKRKEVDENLMTRQARLDGGYVMLANDNSSQRHCSRRERHTIKR
jgi:hypothetical protein